MFQAITLRTHVFSLQNSDEGKWKPGDPVDRKVGRARDSSFLSAPLLFPFFPILGPGWFLFPLVASSWAAAAKALWMRWERSSPCTIVFNLCVRRMRTIFFPWRAYCLWIVIVFPLPHWIRRGGFLVSLSPATESTRNRRECVKPSLIEEPKSSGGTELCLQSASVECCVCACLLVLRLLTCWSSHSSSRSCPCARSCPLATASAVDWMSSRLH